MKPRLRAYLGLTLIVAGLVGLAASGDLIEHSALLVAFYGVAGAGFAILASAATSLSLRVALVAAVLLRLVFLPGAPSLSDDYYRYAWDGRVQQAGINPYAHAPRSPRLNRVSYEWRERINHPDLRTVYPPLAELTFLGIAVLDGATAPTLERDASGLLTGDALAFKLLFGAFDLATAAAIWRLAAAPRRRVATTLYLLCPAVIVQTWEAVHLEAAAVFFCVLAALLLLRRRDGWAGVALGLATAFKLTPAALLIPALLGGRAKPARLLAGFVPAFALPYLPYLLSGGATGSLFESGTKWTGGALVFAPLALLMGAEVARLLSAAAFLAGAVWIARHWRGRTETARAFAWTMTLATVCLPIVHAWYWLTPLALGLAAGVWLPVVAGLLAPIPEAFAPAWPGRLPPWRRLAVFVLARPRTGALLPPW